MITYKRLVTFLGDKSAPANIRIILPYMLLNSYEDILPTYEFIIHKYAEFYDGVVSLQFQKSATPLQLDHILYIKSLKYNIKIFYDVDDLLFEIPEYNEAAHKYWNKYSETTKKILDQVDCIVCSTPELAKYMSKYNKTTIFKNRLIKGLWETSPYQIETTKPKILWAGSSSHFSSSCEDGDFSEDIIDFILKTTDKYEWIFVGSLPLRLINNIYITHYPVVHYFDYIRLLKNINADIGIALLKDNNFNKCKSNLKALEYNALGIPGIYSNIAPYKNMSCKVNNINEFIGYIENLGKNYDERQYIKMKDYKTLKDTLYWDNLYIKRYLDIYVRGK
jgi:hypothetical protein